MSIPMTQETLDALNDAATATTSYPKLWGKVELSAYSFGAIIAGGVKEPYDPNNSNHRKGTAIDIYIESLPEAAPNNTKSLEDHHIASQNDWLKLTRPSIFACLGNENLAAVIGKYAQIERVQGSPYWDKSTPKAERNVKITDPKGYEWHYKFIALYEDEAQCRAAYIAAGGKTDAQPARNIPVMVDETANKKAVASMFLNVIVPQAARGLDGIAAREAVKIALASNAVVAEFYTVESPEVIALIEKTLAG